MKDLTLLPANLPVPEDDGACNHLEGMRFPSMDLIATSGNKVDIGSNPVFPPNENAANVLAWLKENQIRKETL